MRTHGCRWLVVSLTVVSAIVLLSACGTGTTSAVTPPSIASISPTTVNAGSAGFTLTVQGANYHSGAVVCWNGAALPTTRVSASQLTATVEGSRLAAGATVTIMVVNPGNDGGPSTGVSFAVNNRLPAVTRLSASSARAGSGGFQLGVFGSGFSTASQVLWNGTVVTTAYVSASELTASLPPAKLVSAGAASVTVVNPPPGGGTSIDLAFSIDTVVPAGVNHITALNMTANGMVWDASRGRLYATLSGTTAGGNSVVAIDPLTGATTAPVFVGGDPNLLALASDASHLWVGLDGVNAIQRVTLPDLAPDLRIDLPPDPSHGPQVARAMQAAPANPDTLAVLVGESRFMQARTDRLAIFDGPVQRPATIPGDFTQMTWLQWGPDDRTLYGQNAVGSSHDFFVLNVDASGVQMATRYGYIFPYSIQSHYDRATGRVYADDGRVFDPATGVLAGSFNLRDFHFSACLVDPVEPIVFFLGRDAGQYSSHVGYTLRAFDKNTYRQIGNLRFPNVTGDARNLIRWGHAGIAFNTVPERTGDSAAVYLVDGAFVNASTDPSFVGVQEAELLPVFTTIAPESATVGSPDLVLTVSGSQFQPSALVYWQGQPLVTTCSSPTELQAVVPASKLAMEGSATISVANDASSFAVTYLGFTVLPASSGLMVRNLSSLDIAWDAHSSRLYAPVWSADARYPNSVVVIDPGSGSISRVVGAGADPDILRISRDGTLGYIGFLTANLVTQFHVPALDSMLSWCLGIDSWDGPYTAEDLQPAPDAAQTTAIALEVAGSIPSNRGLTIFDDAVARPRRAVDLQGYDLLQWGTTDSVLYATEDSFRLVLHTIGVDGTGATRLRTDVGLSTAYNVAIRIHFDRGTGYLYCDDGYAIDPATGQSVGRYDGWGLLVPDSSLNRVFILSQRSFGVGMSDYTILSFDQSHFTPVGSLTIRELVGNPVAFIRWGTSGLAIVTYNPDSGPISGPAGMLYILDNPAFVSATPRAQSGVER